MTDYKRFSATYDLIGDEVPSPFHPAKNNIRHAGMPPKYSNPLELRAKIDDYFASCAPKQAIDELGRPRWRWQDMVDPDTGKVIMTEEPHPQAGERIPGSKKGVYPATLSVPLRERLPVMDGGRVPTVAALALFLGFKDYRSIYQNHYRDDPAFYAEIKRAFALMGDYAQQQLMAGNTKGATFWLKNHGWVDKVETELYGRDGGAIETKDVSEKDRGILRHFVENYGKRA